MKMTAHISRQDLYRHSRMFYRLDFETVGQIYRPFRRPQNDDL